MPRVEVEIVNKLGLHARASARLTQLAGTFPCEVWMEKGSRRINAKSIMGVMMLAAGKGAKVIVDTEGEMAEAALQALLRLIGDRFGEDE
jgi:phosphocarrier protein